MANMHLVTGYAGREHVTATDQGAFNAAVYGGGQFVLGAGNRLSASVVTNNQVRVLDGDIFMQGRFIRLDKDAYIDLAIDNGASGYFRNDLIVARYTQNHATAIEEVNLVVIKGEAVMENPEDPAYTAGDILGAGDTLHDMPLYRVVIDGLNLVELVPLFELKDISVLGLETSKQNKTDSLAEESSLDDVDQFPFYDTSKEGNRKISWAAIKSVLDGIFAQKEHGHTVEEISKLGFGQIKVGSYVGTGTYGSKNPNRLTFDFEPKCLLITNYGMLMFAACLIPASYGYYSMMYYNSGFAKGDLQMKQNGTEITWYSNSGSPAATWSPRYQMNDSGVTYQYIAIG